MPYTCNASCPMYVDRRKLEKTHWRVAAGTEIKVAESWPGGAPLEESMLKTLGKIPVYDKNGGSEGLDAGWVEGKYFVPVEIPGDPAPDPDPVISGSPTFEDAGRALDVLLRFIAVRID